MPKRKPTQNIYMTDKERAVMDACQAFYGYTFGKTVRTMLLDHAAYLFKRVPEETKDIRRAMNRLEGRDPNIGVSVGYPLPTRALDTKKNARPAGVGLGVGDDDGNDVSPNGKTAPRPPKSGPGGSGGEGTHHTD